MVTVNDNEKVVIAKPLPVPLKVSRSSKGVPKISNICDPLAAYIYSYRQHRVYRVILKDRTPGRVDPEHGCIDSIFQRNSLVSNGDLGTGIRLPCMDVQSCQKI